jgi:hypothetical protein
MRRIVIVVLCLLLGLQGTAVAGHLSLAAVQHTQAARGPVPATLTEHRHREAQAVSVPCVFRAICLAAVQPVLPSAPLQLAAAPDAIAAALPVLAFRSTSVEPPEPRPKQLAG